MQPRSALACFPVLSKQVLDQYQEVDIGVIRTEALAKSWTVDSPRGTERAASPLHLHPIAASALTAGLLLEEHAATPGTCFPSLLILCVIV